MGTLKYKQNRLRAVTLSTGDVIHVRPLQKSDFLQLGDLPSFLRNPDEAKAFDESDKPAKVKAIVENADYFVKMRNHILTKCIVTPGLKVVVDRPIQECSEDETHVDIIDEHDQSLILAAAYAASGVSSGAVATARPFSGKPAATGDT